MHQILHRVLSSHQLVKLLVDCVLRWQLVGNVVVDKLLLKRRDQLGVVPLKLDGDVLVAIRPLLGQCV